MHLIDCDAEGHRPVNAPAAVLLSGTVSTLSSVLLPGVLLRAIAEEIEPGDPVTERYVSGCSYSEFAFRAVPAGFAGAIGTYAVREQDGFPSVRGGAGD